MTTKRWLFVLIILSLVPLLDLWKTGLPITHDGPDHVARIANFYQSLSEGNVVPRWAGNLNWGYGHPILMFLYPLPSYVASLFHFIGFSFVDSTKLVFGVSYIASILAMYLFASTSWGIIPGFAAAVLYGYAPYRFVDLYVRGALGEHVAFVFPPLILWGLLILSKSKGKSFISRLVISLGVAGLILSHNAVALMMLPLIAGYTIYLYIFESKRSPYYLLLTTYYLLLGFALSAFFWIPAFFEGKYTLREIVTKGDMVTRFVPWQWLFYSQWRYGGGNEFTKEVGIGNWLAVFGAFGALIYAKETKIRWFIVGLFVIFAVSLFLMVSGSHSIWNSISLLQKFQFPWRLLVVSVFVSSLFGAIVVARIPSGYRVAAICISLCLVIFSSYTMWRAKGYNIKPEEYYSGIYNSTTDTGESSPIWSVRFMETRPAEEYEVIEGKAVIIPGFRNTKRHEFSVTASSDARIVDNTLYFPGWTLSVDGNQATVEFQDPNHRGLMTFRVPAGEHRVVVHFWETKLRKIANIISLGGFLLFIVSFYAAFRRDRHI